MRFLADMGISPHVVIFRLRNMRPETVNQYTQGIIKQHGDSLEQGAIISVTEGQVRVRPLPIGPSY